MTDDDKQFEVELWAMRLMTPEELDRFTDTLEQIKHEDAWMQEWQARPDLNPGQPLSAADREEYFAHEARWRRAHDERHVLIRKYTGQVAAWGKLIDYSLEAIEALFEDGKLDRAEKLPEFWRLVYLRILRDHGSAISTDPRWKNVKVLEVLKDQMTSLLPGFADLHFRRKRGNPILAQFLEKLVGEISR